MKFVATNFKTKRGVMRFTVTEQYLLIFTKQHSEPTNEGDLGTRNDHDCSTETSL